MMLFRRALMGLAVAGTMLAGTSLSGAPARAETVVPLATWGGASHVGVREFVPSMERALKDIQPNSLKLQHFPGGQIGQDKDMPVAIPTGQVKFGWITVNGWTGTVPDTLVFDAPTGLTMKQLDQKVDAGLLKALQAKFAAKNSVLLGLADLGPPAIVSKVPIKKPADFKGLKVRVFSEGQADAVKAFGGSPVKIAFAEVYPALQYGTADAAIIGFQGVDSQKMHEVAKHVLVPASFLGTTMMGWAANKQWHAGLSAADRKAFDQAVDRASRENREAIVKEIDDLTKLYKDRGMTVTFLSPEMPEYKEWQTITAPLLQSTMKRLSPDVAGAIGSGS
jgi:TRAP-type C4-dicarboxylate transport system substrate-binding protein